MWTSRPKKTRVRRCKLPGFLSTITAPEGSVWSCACGPHEEQIYDTGYFMDPDAEPVEVPLLCMEHRRHEPCRRCT